MQFKKSFLRSIYRIKKPRLNFWTGTKLIYFMLSSVARMNERTVVQDEENYIMLVMEQTQQVVWFTIFSLPYFEDDPRLSTFIFFTVS